MLRRSFAALTLAAAIGGTVLLPTPALAKSVVIRVYDRDHRDYHRWDRTEDRRYRAYLTERHRRYEAFRRASRARQIAYWRWRHEVR